MDKLKVLMIGTTTCTKCKSILPVLDEFCRSRNILYQYLNISEVPEHILKILTDKGVTSAPAFLIYKGDETVVVTGDEVFVELESI